MKHSFKSITLASAMAISSLISSSAPVFAEEIFKQPVQDVYRLYNKSTGEHFYTASADESNHLQSVGWKYEGTGWKAFTTGDPVYRLYNPNNGGDHYYTANADEANKLVALGWRWKYEGTGWKAFTTGDPVYRLYNPNNGGDHYYTANADEANKLVALGWRWDNNAQPVFYSGGNYDLYVEYNPNAKSGAHNYTTNASEHNALFSMGWTHGAVAWKVAGEGEPYVEPAKPVEPANPVNPTPSAPVEEQTYLANKNSKVFHRPTCPSAHNMKVSNRWEVTATREYLIQLGYTPCKVCRP